MTAALPAPVRRGDVRIFTAERALAEKMDALSFLERLADGDAFYFERESDGLALATVGRLSLPTGEDGSPVPLDSEHDLRVGGFAFDRARSPSGPWSGFPPSEWIAPRMALLRRPDGVWLRASATSEEGGLERAAADLERAIASLRRSPTTSAAPRGEGGYRIEPQSSAERWRLAVEATLEDIARGRLHKAVLARVARVVADVPWQRWRVARRLRTAQPGTTVFAVVRGARTFVGATPERLVRLEGRRLTTAAVAGTAPPAAPGGRADAAFLSDPKERREHAIVVDELRRRLQPLVGDLTVPSSPSVLSTATVRHLYTPIHACLREDESLPALCAELHPTPAVAGLPRDSAMTAVREREAVDRGWYAGGVGWFDPSGGEVVVPLRAALLDGAEALLWAGAGIVAGSRWDAELEEVRLKMRVMLAALVEL